MIDSESVTPLSVKTGAHVADSDTHLPAYSERNSSTRPPAVASNTRPGRIQRRYTPISMAIGIDKPIVTVPHGLSRNAFTTTRASTEIRMIMMPRMETSAVAPATVPISSFAICPNDLPSRRIDAQRITKSWTAPPSTTPTRIQSAPGRKPNWAASVGPTSGPGPAIAAKWWPNTIHLLVGT